MAHGCRDCVYMLSSTMLKRILLFKLEMGNMMEGTALQNMGCGRTSHGTQQPGGNFTRLELHSISDHDIPVSSSAGVYVVQG